jgi:hypothetical protein
VSKQTCHYLCWHYKFTIRSFDFVNDVIRLASYAGTDATKNVDLLVKVLVVSVDLFVDFRELIGRVWCPLSYLTSCLLSISPPQTII